MANPRTEMIDPILAYAENELLCHRAAEPPELVEAQQAVWQPLLDWCMARFGALLETGTGIMPIEQSAQSLQALRRALEAYDDKRLEVLDRAVRALGSLVLGLALAERHISAVQALDAAELDATYQMKKWGEDPATLARYASIRRDLEACVRCFGMSDA
jgi:chaperone required for assembly of F1-ATPase